MKIRTTATIFSLLLLSTGLVLGAEAPTHFDKARELYAKGPMALGQVLVELELELADNPENDGAMLMQAIAERGLALFDDSLATLDRLEKLNSRQKKLNPLVYRLIAENHYFKRDYAKTLQLLEAYWGIFQTSDDLKRMSQALKDAAEKGAAAEKLPRPAAVPRPNTVVIHPKEVYYARFEQTGNALKLIGVSKEKSDDAQITFTMQPYDKRAGLLLIVENKFKTPVAYRAEMRVPGRPNPEETSVVNLMPDIKSIEAWPHAIEELALFAFELKP